MKYVKLYEQFLNEYNVASSGIITMYNLDPETKKRFEAVGATVKEEDREGKDVTYEVSFATKAIGEDILNILQEVDPLPMPDLVHLYQGLFEGFGGPDYKGPKEDDMFTNLGYDDDGLLIGSCKICNKEKQGKGNGVDVVDHREWHEENKDK